MDMDFEIPSNMTMESLERNGFNLLQLKDGFRYGTDTTLLAWFAASFVRRNRLKGRHAGIRVMELGSNAGAASLLFCARFMDILSLNDSYRKSDRTSELAATASLLHLDSIEINTPSYEVLCKNIEINSLENIVFPHNVDLRQLPEEIKSQQYDIVFFNPPFFNSKQGPMAAFDAENSNARLNGRFEENGDINDFVEAASKRVYPDSGFIVMIMQGGRLQDALNAFNKFGVSPMALLNIHPFEYKNATMFLLAGRKSSKKSDFKLLPPLILNEQNPQTGAIIPTANVNRIYNEVHTACFI